jgi:hypothetical protein
VSSWFHTIGTAATKIQTGNLESRPDEIWSKISWAKKSCPVKAQTKS